MKNEYLVKMKGVSKVLTGNEDTVKSTRIAKVYELALLELDDLLDCWVKRHTDNAIGKIYTEKKKK